MAELFTPFNLVGLLLKNRIVLSPMCMYSATPDGQITDWHRVHYPTRAVGGVGLIVVEATAVESRGRITERDLGIWSDRQIEGLSEIVRLVHGFGAKIGIQLAHAGRKSQVSEPIVAPSELPFNPEAAPPHSLTANEIRGIVQAFGEGARRAREAGFDLVEIHAAHGYLINEFLSPLANKREDEYGGSLVNRFRLLGEVISEVRRYWSGALFVRLSAEEYAEGGNHIEEGIEIARMLKDLAIDLVDVSSGGVVEVPLEDYPGYQVGFSEQIKQRAEIPTGAVGLITDARQAEGILLQKQADLIFLGRELLRHPYWPLDAAKCLEADIPWPSQYERAKS